MISKRNSLDGMRGLAALMVCIHHSIWVGGDDWQVRDNFYIFVDLFFMLSGFVFFKVYSHGLMSGMTARQFWVPRFARLYPLHLVFLLAWLLFNTIKYISNLYFGFDFSLVDYTAVSFGMNLFLIQAWGGEGFATWNFPAWSVSVEFFLYITFFLSVKFIPRGYYLMFSIFIITSSLMFFIVTGVDSLSEYDVSLARGLFSFYIGSMIYKLSAYSLELTKKHIYIIRLFEILSLGGIMFLIINPLSLSGDIVLVLLFFIILLGIVVTDGQTVFGCLTSHPVGMYFGERSYSIYMSHALVFVIITKLLSDLVGLGVVSISVNDTGRDFRLIVYEYWYLVNMLLLLITLLVAEMAHQFIEKPMRIYFRKKSGVS